MHFWFQNHRIQAAIHALLVWNHLTRVADLGDNFLTLGRCGLRERATKRVEASAFAGFEIPSGLLEIGMTSSVVEEISAPKQQE